MHPKKYEISKDILKRSVKHIHLRLSKSIWLSHPWLATTFIEIREKYHTICINNLNLRSQTYKILSCYCIATWHLWICEYKYYKILKWRHSISFTVLCLNPLLFLLRKLKSHSYGKHRNQNLTHNFFIDYLQLCASSYIGSFKSNYI